MKEAHRKVYKWIEAKEMWLRSISERRGTSVIKYCTSMNMGDSQETDLKRTRDKVEAAEASDTFKDSKITGSFSLCSLRLHSYIFTGCISLWKYITPDQVLFRKSDSTRPSPHSFNTCYLITTMEDGHFSHHTMIQLDLCVLHHCAENFKAVTIYWAISVLSNA